MHFTGAEMNSIAQANAKRMECARFTGALDWTLPRASNLATSGITHSGAKAHALHVLARSMATQPGKNAGKNSCRSNPHRPGSRRECRSRRPQHNPTAHFRPSRAILTFVFMANARPIHHAEWETGLNIAQLPKIFIRNFL